MNKEIVEIQDIFINLFDLEVKNVDVKYLKNVYFLKMNELVALEVNLINNDIENEN